MKENNCICKQCNKNFFKKPSIIKKIKGNFHFCSQNCWHKYQNNNKKLYIDKCSFCGKEVIKKISKKKFLKTGKVFCDVVCKKSFSFKNKYKGKSKIGQRKLSEYLKRTDANRYTSIRDNAKRITSKREQKCFHCGYDKKVITCHIKDIAHFTEDSKLEEINNENNLILLCPNHHSEFDDWKRKKNNSPCPIKLL